MKIDLHCHTIKAKSGDGGRDIDPASLAEALAGNQVGIAAITTITSSTFQYSSNA